MNQTRHMMQRYREAAEKLFDILDDIDTASDGFKENLKGYRAYVYRKDKERFKWLRPSHDTQSLRLTQPSERDM